MNHYQQHTSANKKIFLASSWFLKEVVKLLKKVIIGGREVRQIWQLRQSLIAQYVQLLHDELATCSRRLSWRRIISLSPHSVNQRWLLLTKLLKHFINFLTVLLQYNHNRFAQIQEVVVKQETLTLIISWWFLGIGNCGGTSSRSNHLAKRLNRSIFHRMSQFVHKKRSFLFRRRWTEHPSKGQILLIFAQAFWLFNFPQMLFYQCPNCCTWNGLH